MYLLETPRLGLRALNQEDTTTLYRILGDPETMQYYPAPFSAEQVDNWITRNIESYRQHGFGLWAIILKATGELIGQCGISWQQINGEMVPEIGYHIHKAYWKKGYATEAAQACLHYGFQNFAFDRLFIHTYVKNMPSRRIAEKLGMKHVKTYDKLIKSHHLVWQHVVYAITRAEAVLQREE